MINFRRTPEDLQALTEIDFRRYHADVKALLTKTMARLEDDRTGLAPLTATAVPGTKRFFNLLRLQATMLHAESARRHASKEIMAKYHAFHAVARKRLPQGIYEALQNETRIKHPECFDAPPSESTLDEALRRWDILNGQQLAEPTKNPVDHSTGSSA